MPQFLLLMVTREYIYGMQTSIMEGLQTNVSTYEDNTPTTFSPYNTHLAFGSAVSNLGRNIQPSLNTTSLFSLRHQIDESNHDIVNMLTQQICTMFNPLI